MYTVRSLGRFYLYKKVVNEVIFDQFYGIRAIPYSKYVKVESWILLYTQILWFYGLEVFSILVISLLLYEVRLFFNEEF